MHNPTPSVLLSRDYSSTLQGYVFAPRVGGLPYILPGVFPTVKVTAVAGYTSSDGSAGFTGTVTTASLVGKTITIKDGIITNVA